MMPLALANAGEELIIRKVGGLPDQRQHLEDLGFVPGSTVQIITELNGNLIVTVKNTRIAVSREMARKIMV